MKSKRSKAVRRPRTRASSTAVDREREALTRVLAERVKELALLHQTAHLLQTNRPLSHGLVEEIVRAIPHAWQYPEICAARIIYGQWTAKTPGWRESPWKQAEAFRTADGTAGVIEVVYAEERPDLSEGPFLAEERQLIKSLADMLAAFLERTIAEMRVRRLNRTYEVLSGINSAIVRIHDREKLFREACRIAVEHGQFGLAWVGLLDRENIAPVYWSGPDVNPELLDRLAHAASVNTTEGMGPIARSVRERRPAYSNDVAADPSIPNKAGLLELDLRSYIALPLIVSDAVIGVLALHTTDPEYFDADEVRLLTELAEDISFALEYIEREEQVADLVYHEPLTHLPNRAALQRRLVTAVEDAAAKGHTIALMLMNLDTFRDINNSLGHQNGDQLLRHVADTLREALWGSDQVASLGGDEFAILLPRLAEKSDIDVVLEKIRSSLQAPVNLAGIPLNVEFTLGIALFPDHGDAADLLWQHADVALRTAKQRHEPHLFYSSDFDHYDPQRLALVGELRDAIHADQLVLHFQPIIDVRTGHTAAIEALVRWQHPSRGLTFPDVFIPLAERTGLINPLTTFVIWAALRKGVALEEQGLRLQVSVNLSARNLHDLTFCTRLLDMLRASGFPLERLILEITESAIMHDPIRARKVLNDLHGAGIQLSMDDFGIGQSSLSYLKDLPISRIKIDKSFLIGYWQPRNAAIVRSAIELARNLEFKVTAEGVEDESTYLELRKLGCDLAQGYYFSRPLPADQLSDWLRNSEWK